MAVVIASALDKDMAGSPLFRGVSFKLERGDRMTLAGRNGAGKTTLLRMVSGETGIDGGQLVFEKGTRSALHDQRPPGERELTLRDYVLSGCRYLVALEDELRRLEGEMAERPDDRALLDRYSRAQGRLEHAGGWDWRNRALGPLHGLGFTDEQLDRRLATFSGGELTRASLARALAGDPDLLLLDEPTNHVDIVSLEWLEEYLTGLDAAVVLVAHDRWFLEAVGTSVLELEAGRARFFPGSWHAWRSEAAARDIQLGKQIEKQQAEIARMERFVERFRYKATKARQAQSRVKRLEKMERIERDPADNRSLGFSFGGAERAGRVVLDLQGGRLEVPGRTLLDDGELWLERGEHVSLVGPNGAGKTTLIEALAGRRELDGGKLRTGHNVQIGYLSQHAEELGSSGTVLEAAQRATGLTPNKARALLGRFLFSGREAEKPLDGLSGGERAALAGDPRDVGGERADPRRADEPPGHRRARGARGRAQRLRRHGAARVPRQGAPRRGRNAHVRDRGRHAAELSGRLGRVLARARGAPRRRGEREGEAEAEARQGEVERALEAHRPIQERRQAGDRAGARGGPGRGAAARARGRAGRPVRLGQPHEQRACHEAARRREEGRRERLCALGGGLAVAP